MVTKHSKNAIDGYLKNKQQPNLGSYNALANQYTDAVREPGALDALGDAYTQAGSGPANGPAQDESNALLTGMGAGFQAYANNQRKQKLSPIEEQTQSLLQMDAMLKQQMYEEEGQNQKVRQLFKQITVPVAELSKAAMSGDIEAANQKGRGILRIYKNIFQDPSVGDFDHYHNGTIYYENLETGQIEGRNIVQLMYQSGVDPAEMFGQDAPMIEAGLSPGAKMNYENTLKTKQYELENLGLQNQKIRSDIDLNRFKAKPQQSEKALEKTAANEEVLSLLGNARKRVQNLGEKASRGNFERYIADNTPGGYSMSSQEAEINTLGETIKGKLFNAFGYRNEAEFNHVPTISINNTPETNLAIIDQLETLFKKTGGNPTKSVRMRNKTTGEEFDVPNEKVELFKKNGYE